MDLRLYILKILKQTNFLYPKIDSFRGANLECYADKMREVLPTFDWLLLLYLVCVLCQSQGLVKVADLYLNPYFFGWLAVEVLSQLQETSISKCYF